MRVGHHNCRTSRAQFFSLAALGFSAEKSNFSQGALSRESGAARCDSDRCRMRPAYLQRDQSAVAQTVPHNSSDTSTAALPMSLARFASTCHSTPTRSTAASTAEFNNSTTITATTVLASNTASTQFLPTSADAGSNTTAIHTSWRNAVSSHAARSPAIEWPPAYQSRCRPARALCAAVASASAAGFLCIWSCHEGCVIG